MGLSLNVIEPTEVFSFHLSYSGFEGFRQRLANLIGIDLNKMNGHGGDTEWEDDIPFVELLDHSDCEGKLTFDECKNLSDDFEEYKKSLKGLGKGDKFFKAIFYEWKEAVDYVMENEYRFIEFA